MKPVYIPGPASWWERLSALFRRNPPVTVRRIGPPQLMSDEVASKLIALHISNATPHRRLSRD